MEKRPSLHAYSRWMKTLQWLGAFSVLLIAGCFNPANWNQEQVAKDIKEQWAKYNITEVSLTAVSDGFEGTAKSTEGETFKISLKKDMATKSVRGTGIGDRGTELDYSVAAK